MNNGKEEPGATLPVNDAERWIAGTYAIWSEYCGGSSKYLGGYEKNGPNAKMVAEVLEEDWLVTDHKSGVDTVTYLMENAGPGEHEDLEEDEDEEEDFEEEDFEDDDEDEEEDYQDDDIYGGNLHIDTTAFDYACACNMCGRMFIAGYFSREESIRYAAKVAKKIQERYSSWVEYFQEYIIGAARGSNVGEMTPFVEAYQKVLTSPDSPLYLDWNTPL